MLTEGRNRSQDAFQMELVATPKAVLRRIRNYLAGQVVGLTRDETLLDELLKCAFCRVALERNGKAPALGQPAPSEQIASLYRAMFEEVQQRLPSLFTKGDGINLEAHHIAYIDQELSTIDISTTSHDVMGDIYETFIGSGYRGQEGQFFTPRAAVRTLVELADPSPNDLLIDPACGSGSFLLEAIRHISPKGQVSEQLIHGVDKDAYLVRLSKLHLALQHDAVFPIECADSLAWGGNGFDNSPTKSLSGQFSLVLTNPPFGSKIVAITGDTRHDFDLAHKWSFSKRTGRYHKQADFASKTPPQVLFVERCLSLVAPGGRLGMVLPESILSNPSHRHVVQYMLDHVTPIAVIGMPESLFKTSGRGGTHTKVDLIILEKREAAPDHQIFMAEAKWCGHDSRAREIPRDDLPTIVQKYHNFKAGLPIQPDRFGFLVPYTNLRNNILAPRLYDPDPVQAMGTLSKSHDLYLIRDLVEAGLLSIRTGDEVGKLAYGSGEIPFVRTSDISNWEIKVDPKHLVNREVYQKYAAKQDVREGDILMVRDGTYLIGTCAFVSRYDTRIVYQSHIFKLRLHEGAPFDNYVLLAALSSPPVAAQIKAMSFTQDIIDTLGDRIYDLALPIPKSEERRREISDMVSHAIESRIVARELSRKARLAIVADTIEDLEAQDVIE